MMARVVTIDELVVGDPADAWERAGFRVDERAECRIGHVAVRLVGRDRGPGILSWTLGGVDPALIAGSGGTIDGLATDFATAPRSGRPDRRPPAHPNGCTVIDHVVVATPDCDRTTAALGEVGLSPRRERRTERGRRMRQVFFRAGEVIVELVGPEAPRGSGRAAFFGVACTVPDLDATATLLGEGLGPARDAVQPGRRIATLRHHQLGVSAALAFISDR